jgi:hypothetical protein
MEINIIKLMRATLGEVEFTDAVQNRISQRLRAKKQAAAQAFGKQLPLFPEISLLENSESVIGTELEISNFLCDFSSTIITSEEISPEYPVEWKKLNPLQLLLPGFEL